MNASLRKVWASLGAAVLGLTMLTVIDVKPADARPPAHAPAHGYRRKQAARTYRTYRPAYSRTRPSQYTVYRRMQPYRRDRRYSTYNRYSRYNRSSTYRTNRYPRAKDIDRDGVRNRYDRDMDGDGRRNHWDKDVDGDGRRNRNDDHRRNPKRR
ncbi:MAG: hypothetical protein ACK47B_14085 [Armatimonadota bacterium]